MSDNKQLQLNANKVRRSLILILAAAVIGVGWYAYQNRNGADQPAGGTQQETQEVEATSGGQEDYEGWQDYTWASQGFSFKHPEGWVVEENATMSRLYVKNSDVNLLTEETPDNFQQIWFSYDNDEAAQQREEDIKKGVSQYRAVNSEVKASTIEADGIIFNVYEYETLGGATLEAYWTTEEGKRVYATNSTDVGEPNQTEMVATLKKVLASVTLPE
jgi:hypothetical protein